MRVPDTTICRAHAINRQHRSSPASSSTIESPPGDSDRADRPKRLISAPRQPAVREEYSGIFVRSVSLNSQLSIIFGSVQLQHLLRC
jgi:hypothetical protein